MIFFTHKIDGDTIHKPFFEDFNIIFFFFFSEQLHYTQTIFSGGVKIHKKIKGRTIHKCSYTRVYVYTVGEISKMIKNKWKIIYNIQGTK